MDLELTDIQQELRSSAAGALDRHAPLALARSYLDGAGDGEALRAELAQLGWYGIALGGEHGFGAAGLCLVGEQLGRHAAPTTVVDTALLVRVAEGAGSPWAQRLAEGAVSATLAMLEPDGDWTEPQWRTTARRDGDAIVLTGAKIDVHHAAGVERIGVVATLGEEPVLALVERDAPGVSLGGAAGIDPSCAAAQVLLEDVAVAREDVLGRVAIADATAPAIVATAAEGIGACSAALELAVEHALAREQFGRPIAGFQAIRHMLAEAHVLRETAWASVLYAAAAIDEGIAAADEAVAVAKAHASVAARTVCESALQVLGGVGFTREHDFHLLYRRAIACERRFGDAAAHERRVAAMLSRRVSRHAAAGVD